MTNKISYRREAHLHNLYFPLLTIFYLNISAFAQDMEVTDPDPTRYREEIEAFVNWDQKNSYPSRPIVFVGSSSIRLWSTREAFGDYPVINRGLGGSHVSDVNYFFDLIVKKYQPVVIVFYAGDNDVAAGKSPQQVYDDYEEFADRVRKELLDARIVYVSIKPSINRWQFWSAMRETNSMIENLSKSNDKLYYADTAASMIGPDGRPKPELFVDDGLHLSNEGYRVWESILRSYLAATYIGESNRE